MTKRNLVETTREGCRSLRVVSMVSFGSDDNRNHLARYFLSVEKKVALLYGLGDWASIRQTSERLAENSGL